MDTSPSANGSSVPRHGAREATLEESLRLLTEERDQLLRDVERARNVDFETELLWNNAFSLRAHLDQPVADFDWACFCVVSVDRFEEIEHEFGSPVAFDLLRAVASTLVALTAPHPLAKVRRMSGPRLLVCLPALGEDDEQALVEAMAEAGRNHGSLPPGVESALTIGVAVAEHPGQTVAELTHSAALALTEERRRRPGQVGFYEPTMSENLRERLAMGSALREAIANREIDVHFQPQIFLADGSLAGVETLARWHHPAWGTVEPYRFIGIAEEVGLIRDLDRLIWDKALAHLREWDAHGVRVPTVAVNVSPVTFDVGRVPEHIRHLLLKHGVEPDRVTLELTETHQLNTEQGRAQLDELADIGVRLSLDDFGTGYSSFASLAKLPLTEVKIDKSLMYDRASLTDSAGNLGLGAVAKAAINVGRTFELDVVAEGIETADHERFVVETGGTVGQGYYYARPMEPQVFLSWLKQRQG